MGNVRVWRSFRQGIPTVEITIGDYLRDWEIAELWEEAEAKIAEARLNGQKITEAKREGNKFRSYIVESVERAPF